MVSADVQALRLGIVALRRALHRQPELAFEETGTACTLAACMRTLGLSVQIGVGGTGVVAVLEGARPGPTLLVRADMDALPIDDMTGTDYASTRPGRNHACGHDVHAAIVVGVAQVLSRHRAQLAGRVAFVFQPADEPMRGARRMIEDGVLERLAPDMSLALHVLPMAESGHVVVQRGPLWASWDTRRFTITGPPPPFDVVRVAAEVTSTLYAVVETQGQSADPVTFRVRVLQAEQRADGEPPQAAIETLLGRGWPSRAALETNLAVYDHDLRARLLARLESAARAIVGAAGGTLDVATDYALPPLVNDERVTGAVERAARHVLGDGRIIRDWRNRFSDDFGLFMAAAPGCLMLLGTASADKGITEIWHRPRFDVDEDAIPIGMEILSLAALDVLR